MENGVQKTLDIISLRSGGGVWQDQSGEERDHGLVTTKPEKKQKIIMGEGRKPWAGSNQKTSTAGK